MHRISSILLIAVLLSGCGSTEQETTINVDKQNSLQEQMIKEGRALDQNKEDAYKKFIVQHLEEQTGPTEGLVDEN